MKITRRLGTSPAQRGCGPDNVGCPDVLRLDNGDFLVIGKTPGTPNIPAGELARHGAAIGTGEQAVVVPADVLLAAAQDIARQILNATAQQPGGVRARIRQGEVRLKQWDSGPREDTLDWLGDTPHRWEDGHLVLPADEKEEVPLKPGWLLVGWPDGLVTGASRRTAARLFEPLTEKEVSDV